MAIRQWTIRANRRFVHIKPDDLSFILYRPECPEKCDGSGGLALYSEERGKVELHSKVFNRTLLSGQANFS